MKGFHLINWKTQPWDLAKSRDVISTCVNIVTHHQDLLLSVTMLVMSL